MNLTAGLRGNFTPLSQCSSCCDIRFQPFTASSVVFRRNRCRWSDLQACQVLSIKLAFGGKRRVVCRVAETETEPESNNDKDKEAHEDGEKPPSTDPLDQSNLSLDSQPIVVDQDKDQFVGTGMLDSEKTVNNNNGEIKVQDGIEDVDNVEVASGSPLPATANG